MTHSNQKANALLALHGHGELLVLPNVWNPIGARILQARGAKAIATASAAISASLGYHDGEKIKRATLLDLITRIASAVDLPVTADIEAGYGESVAELEETISAVLDAGVVGINIEDSLEEGATLRSVKEQSERIARVREVADRRDVHLVINARADAYRSAAFETKQAATEEVVTRAKAYADAGADCIYPMGPGDEETVRELRARIDRPINILATPSAAPLAVLESIGVNRVSLGPFVFRSCLTKFIDITDTLLRKGDYSCFSDMLSMGEVSEYLTEGAE